MKRKRTKRTYYQGVSKSQVSQGKFIKEQIQTSWKAMERLPQISVVFWTGIKPLNSQNPVSSPITSKCTEESIRRVENTSKEVCTEPHRKKCVINFILLNLIFFSLLYQKYTVAEDGHQHAQIREIYHQWSPCPSAASRHPIKDFTIHTSRNSLSSS